MRTSWKRDFRKLKITLVTMTYHSQRPQAGYAPGKECVLLWTIKGKKRKRSVCSSTEGWKKNQRVLQFQKSSLG